MYKLYKTGKKHRATEALTRRPAVGRPAEQGEGRGRIFHITGPKRPQRKPGLRCGKGDGAARAPAVKKPQKVEALRGKQVVKKSKMWYHKL